MDEPRLMMERLLTTRNCPANQTLLFDKKGLMDPRSMARSCGHEYHCSNGKMFSSPNQQTKKNIPQPFPHPISAPYIFFRR
jgi:hypothetical protein